MDKATTAPFVVPVSVSVMAMAVVAFALLPVEGHAQDPALAICEAVDTSGSIDRQELELEVEGLRRAFTQVILPTAQQPNVTIRLAIVRFSTNVEVILPLTEVSDATRDAILAAIDSILQTRDRRLTNLGGAIDECVNILRGNASERRAIDLVTDGVPTTGPDAAQAAEAAKGAGLEVWTMGVGDGIDEALLRRMAGCPPAQPDCSARFFRVESFQDFVQAIQDKTQALIVGPGPGPGNRPPVAEPDRVTIPPNVAVRLRVLDNDSDPDGDPLTITAVTPPAHGTATLNPDGTITYTPAPNFEGTDTFQYTVSDGRGGTATATVTVIVRAGAPLPPGGQPLPPPPPPAPGPPTGIPLLAPPWAALLVAALAALLVGEIRRQARAHRAAR